MKAASNIRSGGQAGTVPEPPVVLVRLFIFLCGLLIFLWAVPAAGTIVMWLAVLHALRGPRQSIEALGLLALLIMLNHGLVPIDTSTMRWIIILAAFARTVWDTLVNDKSLPPIAGPLLIFSVTVFVLALLVSVIPLVSILKVVTFVAGVGSALAGFHRTPQLRDYWFGCFVTLGLFILFASLPLYGSSIGYLRNGVGFQGILNHPQTYGPVIAPLSALLTGVVLFRDHPSRIVMAGAVVSWVAIYTSQSRTAILAFVLSFMLVAAVGFFLNTAWRDSLARAVSRTSFVFILGGGLFIAVLQWSNIQTKLTEVLLKGDASSSITESLGESRRKLISRSMENFYDYPVTGIGFGVPSNIQSTRVETGALGLPTSASVEKGFMLSAVLEETGIVGALLVVVLLIALIKPVVKYGSITTFWVLICCLLINAGEMIFFSVGGMGLYFWMLMAFCYNRSRLKSTFG